MNREEFETQYARYLAGELDEKTRGHFESEVLNDRELSDEFYSDQNLMAKMAARRVSRASGGWWRWATPLAAAAVLVLALNLGRPTGEHPGTTMRGDAARIGIVHPQGTLNAVPMHFEWIEVEGATSYRVEVLDGEAKVVARFESTTNRATFSGNLPSHGAWRVIALDATGQRIAGSGIVRWTVENN